MSETKMYSVLDKWTDLDKENIVDFTSVDGVVTEARLNGVPVGGGGGGDYSTATVTFRNIQPDSAYYNASCFSILDEVLALHNGQVDYGVDVSFTVPLYKGKILIPLSCVTDNDTSYMPTVEGNIELDIPSFAYVVTGDCVISAKGQASA